ncbi:hypothetical protein HAHE_35890 [Haloferula helveola]|uniref:FG-GAP repeat protein n=1 Tax=Haloferula helveola TaxID=490095 RepID=A0ABM7RQR5_9BACT|nr:hypothetical protein HAHE_35890 [Haloferula helveola]
MSVLRLFSILVLVSGVSAEAFPPTSLEFLPLEDLPGGSVSAQVSGISSDGTAMCGQSSSTSGSEATRWLLPFSVEGLGDLPNSPFLSNAADISGDGSRTCGSVVLGVGVVRASRWVEGQGHTQLGTLNTSGYQNSDARGISDDGSKVVGISTSPNGLRAFLWTASGPASGSMQSLGVLTPSPSQTGDSVSVVSQADDISADGSTVVGSSTYTVFRNTPDPDPNDGFTPPPTPIEQGSMAFRWTASGGMVGLGDLPGGALSSQAFGVSDDGRVIVGSGESAAGGEGVVWTDGTPAGVGDIPGGATYCRLLAVNGAGTVAVGEGTDDTGKVAVIWDASNGLRKLSAVLANAGLELSGWSLTGATAISRDGDVIAGNSINPSGHNEGWVVSGINHILSGGTPEEVSYPVPVTASLRVASGLSANNATAHVTARSDGYERSFPVSMSQGTGSRVLYLPHGASYGLTAEFGKLDGGAPQTVVLGPATTVSFVLDGDSDGDGLLDSEEVALGTDFNHRDTDRDGLSDFDEVRTHGTDPKRADTDGDRVNDSAEIGAGTDPLNPADKPVAITVSVSLAKGVIQPGPDATIHVGTQSGTVTLNKRKGNLTFYARSNTTQQIHAEMDPLTSGTPVVLALSTRNAKLGLTLDFDTDGDGLIDSKEAKARSDRNDRDSDDDGIPDGEEVILYKTSPTRADTDGDGFTDPQEIAMGSSPTSGKSKPDAFIERRVEMDLGIVYTDLSGLYHDDPVDTAGFAYWLSSIAGSPRAAGELWMRQSLDGKTLQWLIRGDGPDLDVTKVMKPPKFSKPVTMTGEVVEPHAAGESFGFEQSFGYSVSAKGRPSLNFILAGPGFSQPVATGQPGEWVDLADPTGDMPWRLTGALVDPTLTGTRPGLLSGTVDLAGEIAVPDGSGSFVVERELTTNLELVFINGAGIHQTLAVDTATFAKWISTIAGSPRDAGQLWMQYSGDGTTLKWWIRGDGPDLDVSRVMRPLSSKKASPFDFEVVEPHAPGDSFSSSQIFGYRAARKGGPTLGFTFSGKSGFSMLELPQFHLALNVAEATGERPYEFFGMLVDPALTGSMPGILYGTVSLAAEEAVILGDRFQRP